MSDFEENYNEEKQIDNNSEEQTKVQNNQIEITSPNQQKKIPVWIAVIGLIILFVIVYNLVYYFRYSYAMYSGNPFYGASPKEIYEYSKKMNNNLNNDFVLVRVDDDKAVLTIDLTQVDNDRNNVNISIDDNIVIIEANIEEIKSKKSKLSERTSSVQKYFSQKYIFNSQIKENKIEEKIKNHNLILTLPFEKAELDKD